MTNLVNVERVRRMRKRFVYLQLNGICLYLS
jgi:hypothetical protein